MGLEWMDGSVFFYQKGVLKNLKNIFEGVNKEKNKGSIKLHQKIKFLKFKNYYQNFLTFYFSLISCRRLSNANMETTCRKKMKSNEKNP